MSNMVYLLFNKYISLYFLQIECRHTPVILLGGAVFIYFFFSKFWVLDFFVIWLTTPCSLDLKLEMNPCGAEGRPTEGFVCFKAACRRALNIKKFLILPHKIHTSFMPLDHNRCHHEDLKDKSLVVRRFYQHVVCLCMTD